MATPLRLTPLSGSMTEPGTAHESNDPDLVARAQRGDVGAFEALYHATSGRVFALCLRMCGDRERATELLQDVFVRIWEKLASFHGESAFATWAHRLAINVVLETERKDSRREARVSPHESPEVFDSGRESPIEHQLDLETAIAQLAPGMRRVFVLHDVEGYQHNEIAKMTGLAEGTLRSQLHHARKLLVEALNR